MRKTTVRSVLIGAGALLALSVQAQAAEDYSGHKAVLAIAEYITDGSDGMAGGTEILQKDLGNGQLTHDFVYNDPRRAGFNGGAASVTYGIKGERTSGDTNLGMQDFWMTESINVWNSLNCADPMLSENATTSGVPGVVELFFLTGQIFAIWEADLTQVGFLSGAEFPYFAANPNVLGVAFTLFWTDQNGDFTDIDNNGKFDVAFREIYYNDDREWADNGVEGTQPDGSRVFDFPTVAIHEVGHGLSAAHFGNIFRKKGVLSASPRTIMNAIYGGTLRELTGRDAGSHCSNWAQWPNK